MAGAAQERTVLKIIFVSPDGARRTVDAAPGTSVMQAALAQGVDEIYADCGGAAMCATCHIYVDESYLDRLSPMADDENDMLDATSSERRKNSRLSCQVKMTESLDGIVVHLPESQT